MNSNYKVGSYIIPELRIGKLYLKDIEVSVLSERLFPRDKIIVGFMGSAGKEPDSSGREFQPTNEDKELGERIGKIVAANNAVLSNGAVWGLPYFPIRGANLNGGYTIGISPYPSRKLHKERNPIKHFDLILYTGIECLIEPRADFTLRDWINTLYIDIAISAGGRIGTPDECLHILEQGGIYIPIRGTGGATDWLIEGIEKGIFNKDTGATVIIADKTQKSLEDSVKSGIEEAQREWIANRMMQNKFSHVADELEKVMWLR